MAISGPQINQAVANGVKPQTSAMSSHDKLMGILRGDVEGIRKINPMVVIGPRLVNKIWRRLVDKYRKDGLDWEQIVQKILDYDLLVENQKITQENILQRAAKK